MERLLLIVKQGQAEVHSATYIRADCRSLEKSHDIIAASMLLTDGK